MLVTARRVVENLVVFEDNMKTNLEKTRGMIFSQGLLLKLIEKGLTREAAYKMVQDCAKQIWENGRANLKDIAKKDSQIKKHMSQKEIDEVFDYKYHTKHVNTIFKRLGI